MGDLLALHDVRAGYGEAVVLDDISLAVPEHGSLAGFGGAESISPDDLLTLKCDVLVPAAVEGVITARNAGRLQCRILAEAANGPTTPDADEVLADVVVEVEPEPLAFLLADRRLMARQAPEPLLVGAQRVLGALTRGDVARDAAHANDVVVGAADAGNDTFEPASLCSFCRWFPAPNAMPRCSKTFLICRN